MISATQMTPEPKFKGVPSFKNNKTRYVKPTETSNINDSANHTRTSKLNQHSPRTVKHEKPKVDIKTISTNNGLDHATNAPMSP